MKSTSVYDHWDFKDYLAERFSIVGDSRGMRIKFAKLIHASPSYVSKVLSGKIKLGLEHIPIINEILQHNEDEEHYFMDLVLYTQAGSKKLEIFFKKKLEATLEERRVRADWIPDKNEIPEEVQAKFYSHWQYCLIYVMTAVPNYQSKQAIATRLRLPLSTVSSTLDYLAQIGLIETKGDRYRRTIRRLHLKKGSEWQILSHSNLRQYATSKLFEPDSDDIHYSLTAALSLKDAEMIKKKIRQMISELEPIVQSNKNEEVFMFLTDFCRI